LPIDVGDKDPSEAIQDLSIGKIGPVEVKESTSSVQVEASTSHQGEPQVDMEASTSGTRQDEGNKKIHLKRMTTPTTMRKLHHNPIKSYIELKQESTRIIPSIKSLAILTPGESLALNLV
jgi:hypothetical protein